MSAELYGHPVVGIQMHQKFIESTRRWVNAESVDVAIEYDDAEIGWKELPLNDPRLTSLIDEFLKDARETLSEHERTCAEVIAAREAQP